MVGSTARKHYLGQGVARLGCAQAVAEALREPLGLDAAFVGSMAGARGGRAPGGYCGAVYAALTASAMKSLNKETAIEEHFMKEAGAVTCREIRANGKLTCADCVEHAANLVG